MNFDQAFDRLIGNEGGYVNDPHDPGGETNWGISKRSYPDLDIKNLTKEVAREIYLRDFWKGLGADQFDPAIGFQLFDIAVNSSPAEARKMLQRAAGVTPDGVVGAKTVAAVRGLSAAQVIMLLNAERLDFWRKLAIWPRFGNGWAGRAANNLRFGAADIG